MKISCFSSGPLSTNCYLIACEKTFKGAVIDPSPGVLKKILTASSEAGTLIEKILLTHSHWDHFADAAALRERTGALVYVHSLDAGNIEEPGADGLPMMLQIRRVPADVLIEEGEQIRVGELHIHVLHTPGHSPGGVCYYLPAEHVVFSGDTLFHGTFGNLSLPTAEPGKMEGSLKRLAALPKETRVFPGHGKDTTIKDERWLDQLEDFL